MAIRGDAKIIVSGEEARQRLLDGAKETARVVAATYGPTSGNVAIGKNWGSGLVTHDGVTVAKEVYFADEVKDMGAGWLTETSKKTNDIAGDGTSLTSILMYHIWEKANTRRVAGYNVMGLRKGIDKAGLYLKEQLDKLSIPIKDEDLHKVASISASDPEIGKLVADTVVKVGGVGITVEDYNGLGVLQDVVDGLYFENGWVEPYFVTDRATEECILEDCYVLVTDKRLSTNTDIVPMLEKVGLETDSKKVLIIGNVTDQALQTCGLSHVNPKSPLQICVVRPPVYGSQLLPFLEDVAALTGGQLIPASLNPNEFTVSMLGHAKKIIVGKSNTTILEGDGIQEDIQARIDNLKKQLKSDKYTAFEHERMEMRLAKLQGKIGIIKVGGATDSEREELKARVVDAVHATRAARDEGIVPGGGATLARLGKSSKSPLRLWIDGIVRKFHKRAVFDPVANEQEGFNLVLEALHEPFKELMVNAGENGNKRLKKLLSHRAGTGFNVKNITEDPINLLEAGVIDPTKVIKQAVENATANAGLAITVDEVIIKDRAYELEQKGLNRAA